MEQENISRLLETALVGGIALASLGLMESIAKGNEKESGELGLFKSLSSEKKAEAIL